ncbi:galectin-8-like isoform X2 [Coccinella septempunctata]|uniref:galectin-8-like isoform X2 n=1 Tax=Coccinella septempunctata TaxID=41139 RepID=UPI001D081F04|nr:galectin-8-like isoform X2 [Coccinella septempunctata]
MFVIRAVKNFCLFGSCIQCCIHKEVEEEKIDGPLRRSISALNLSRIEDLPNRLTRGRVLCITASTTPNCQRWAVNLLCGNSHNSDIAFHFNPRLLQHFVVRNSRLKGQWGNEETLTCGGFQIKHGEEFQLRIYVADSQFFVSYNNKHVCNFAFRISPSNVTHVEVCGMIDVYKIEVVNFDTYPVDGGDVYVAKEISRPISNNKKLVTPLRCVLPESFQQGWQIEIYGVPKILPQSFSISLRDQNYLWPPCTIPLSLTAHFGNNILVRNAFIDNKWGMEERAGGFKFLPFTPFTLWIRRSAKKFSIWVNEKLQAEFAFRCDIAQMNSVHVQGDVIVGGIYINKQPEMYY